jgi:hypothetical protein
MQFLKRLLFGFTTVALLATLTTLLAPKAVHALVATLIRDLDNPGRAVTVHASCDASSVSGIRGSLSCAPAYTVPAGDRLVIQQLEANCGAPLPTSTLVGATLTVDTSGSVVSHTVPLLNEGEEANILRDFLAFGANQPVTYYVDPGSTFTFSTVTTDGSGRTSCSFQFSGYLISYP